MDQCMNCTVRGDIDACMKTPCSQHESWYAQTLKAQQRIAERKPLTDEQILEANTFKCGKVTCVHVQVDGEPENIIGLARAIEAAHGITKEDK